jgi:uncharacterized protein with NAD-binding domain and iron-sulfur cluster
MADHGTKPSVVIAGAGVAGLTAAHRLLQRGFDVTLIEADDFVGGKLGAHQESGSDTGAATVAAEKLCGSCKSQGGCLGRQDWHEHCYHMYLNWYHNFWELMEEIGTLDRFVATPAFFNIDRRDVGSTDPRAIPVVNMGSPWTQLRNLFGGVGTPVDMFLWSQALADLIGEPARRSDWLEKTSITGFMRSHPYVTNQALAGTYRTTAQAFASPSYLSSARSYKTLLSYGLRLPEPTMWLLSGPTQDAIFTPWLKYLARLARDFSVESHEFYTPGPAFQAAMQEREAGYHGPGGSLVIKMLTSLRNIEIDRETGRITRLDLALCKKSPTIHRGSCLIKDAGSAKPLPVDGSVILALPLSELRRLVTPQIAHWAPNLPNVRYLRTEPMISIDLYFRRKLDGLPKGVTVLLDSPYEMSFLDNSQTWADRPDNFTALNVVASNADALTDYECADILDILLKELSHYIAFDRKADLFHCRTHLQTNVGEELFVNQVGSWQWRPRATCASPNLYIAGDFCQTSIDVVTIESAAVSGLMAAEALRRQVRVRQSIRIRYPDQFPVTAMSAYAAAQRPLSYAARAVSSIDEAIKWQYRQWFPNG